MSGSAFFASSLRSGPGGSAVRSSVVSGDGSSCAVAVPDALADVEGDVDEARKVRRCAGGDVLEKVFWRRGSGGGVLDGVVEVRGCAVVVVDSGGHDRPLRSPETTDVARWMRAVVSRLGGSRCAPVSACRCAVAVPDEGGLMCWSWCASWGWGVCLQATTSTPIILKVTSGGAILGGARHPFHRCYDARNGTPSTNAFSRRL